MVMGVLTMVGLEVSDSSEGSMGQKHEKERKNDEASDNYVLRGLVCNNLFLREF